MRETMLRYSGVAEIAAHVTGPDFAQSVLDFVGRAARLRNFGAFFFANIRTAKPVLSIWSGNISDYWFQRNAQRLLTDPARVAEFRAQIRAAPADGAQLRYWQPMPGDPRAEMYHRARLHGRVSISSRSGSTGLQSFFLRDLRDGAFSETERDRLETALPIAHTLIFLRHRMVGTEAVQFLPGSNATGLRARGVTGFAQLSPSEAAICDAIAQGLSVADTARRLEIAASSVRTLRQRAYRKLGVRSAGEVAALMLKNRAARASKRV